MINRVGAGAVAVGRARWLTAMVLGQDGGYRASRTCIHIRLATQALAVDRSAVRRGALAQPQKCQDCEDNHDQADEVDDTVHEHTFRLC
jgi:hypothetical protein